jgi:N-acetylglucosaminyldiphosphoundecaprenol N-acetyl-beta-D-mannosaminyltransferase
VFSPVQIGQATTTLFDTVISRLDLAGAVEECEARIANGTGGYACFVNVHSLTEATRQPALRESLSAATYCFADGVPLIWLSRRQREPIAGRVTGPDFMAALLERLRDHAHGFIGGAPGIGDAIVASHGLRGVTYAPPMRDFTPEHALADWNAFVSRCDGTPPPIVWVGLGAPKQELWLATVSRAAPHVMFFGVGAAFDVLAGAVPRAPRWMQEHGLEWLFRWSREPRRLAARYATTNARFVALVVRDRIRMKK